MTGQALLQAVTPKKAISKHQLVPSRASICAHVKGRSRHAPQQVCRWLPPTFTGHVMRSPRNKRGDAEKRTVHVVLSDFAKEGHGGAASPSMTASPLRALGTGNTMPP